MKTAFTLLSLFILSSAAVFGQLEKCNIFIQGSSSLGFNTEKYIYTSGSTSTEQYKSTTFGFNPKVGYFVIENLPVGLAMNIDTYKSKGIDNDNVYTTRQITFGPFARYYFVPQEKLKPMAQVYVGFGGSRDRNEYSSYSSEQKYGVFEFSAGAGASYFITKQIAFDLLIDYNSSNYNLKSETNTGGIKSTTSEDESHKYTGIGVNIGVVVTIPK